MRDVVEVCMDRQANISSCKVHIALEIYAEETDEEFKSRNAFSCTCRYMTPVYMWTSNTDVHVDIEFWLYMYRFLFNFSLGF